MPSDSSSGISDDSSSSGSGSDRDSGIETGDCAGGERGLGSWGGLSSAGSVPVTYGIDPGDNLDREKLREALENVNLVGKQKTYKKSQGKLTGTDTHQFKLFHSLSICSTRDLSTEDSVQLVSGLRVGAGAGGKPGVSGAREAPVPEEEISYT